MSEASSSEASSGSMPLKHHLLLFLEGTLAASSPSPWILCAVLGALRGGSVGALHFNKEEGLCGSTVRLLERLHCTSWLAHRQRPG